jgi:hypothetical protein
MKWRREREKPPSERRYVPAPSWLCGTWGRTEFAGGAERSTSADETCYNLLTPSLFVDMRIPTERAKLLGGRAWGAPREALASLSARELQLLARQHAFAGYSTFGEAAPRDADGGANDEEAQAPGRHLPSHVERVLLGTVLLSTVARPSAWRWACFLFSCRTPSTMPSTCAARGDGAGCLSCE